jgi:MFS family permease
VLTAAGAFYDNFALMQFSRFVFGIGGESLSVAQNTYASAWFSGEALNMVFGLQVLRPDFFSYLLSVRRH